MLLNCFKPLFALVFFAATVCAEEAYWVEQPYQSGQCGYTPEYYESDWQYADGCESCCDQITCCDNPCDFSVFADFLWVKCNGDQIEYATKTTIDTRNSAQFHTKTKSFQPSFDWNYGYRLGFVYQLPCPTVEFRFDWTHLHASGSSRVASIASSVPGVGNNLQNTFVGIEANPFAPVVQQSAKTCGNIRFDYDYFDFALGKGLCDCSNCFQFNPYAGVRYIHTKENFSSSFSQVYNLGFSGDQYYRRANTRFDGCGILAGFDLRYCLGCDFTLFGRGEGALVWGKFVQHTMSKSQLQNPTDALPNVDQRDTYHIYNNRFVADYRIGISWATCLCEHAVAVDLAWEQHFLFNQTHFDGRLGTMAFQGVAVTGHLDF